jgi:hypothetical protein
LYRRTHGSQIACRNDNFNGGGCGNVRNLQMGGFGGIM